MSRSLVDSIVTVESSDESIAYFGTGFPIYRDEQATYIVTCAHVITNIGGPGTIVVSLKKREKERIASQNFQAELVASGEPYGIDLAVLRVQGHHTLSIWPLRSTAPEQGTSFSLAGYSSPDRNLFEFQILQGSFGTKRQLGGRQRRESRIYVDAWDLMLPSDDTRLQKGHSGSPIIDESQYAVAVATWMRAEGTRGTAISIEALKVIWPDFPPGLFLPWQIPDCRIGEILAREAESVVCKGWYRTSQEQAEELVAIKFLPLDPPTEAFPLYFVRNVRTFQDALASHKHIVALKACGVLSEEHYAYLVMEYAPDRSLDDQLSSGQLIQPDKRLSYVLEIAEALSYAHMKNITHGNLQFSNFLLRSGGILLSDFAMLTRHATDLVDLSSAIPILRQGRVQREREWKDQYDLARIACLLLTAAPSLEDGRRILASTHPGIARVLERALAPEGIDRHSSMMQFHWMLKQIRPSFGEAQVPGVFVPVTPEQGSPTGQPQPSGPARPPDTQTPGDRVSPPVDPGEHVDPPTPRPPLALKRSRLVYAGAALVVLLLMSSVLVFWRTHQVLPPTAFCIATDFATTPGKDDDEIPFRNGADLAMQEHQNLGSGYTLQDRCADMNDQRDPAIGVQNLQAALANTHVLGMVGPASSDVALHDLLAASSNDFSIVSPNTTNPCLTQPATCSKRVDLHGMTGSYARICATDTQQGQADADFLATSLHVQTVFLLDDGTVYGQGLATSFQDRFTGADGGQVLKDAHMIQGVSLDQLARQIISFNPQGIFYGGTTREQGIGTLKKLLVQRNFTGVLMGGDGIALSTQYINDAGTAASQTYATALEPPIKPTDWFYQRYQHDYGQVSASVVSLAAGGYDAAMLLIDAIETVIKTNRTVLQQTDVRAMREAVLQAVQSTWGYTGLTGTVTMHGGDNAAVTALPVYQILATPSPQWVPYARGRQAMRGPGA